MMPISGARSKKPSSLHPVGICSSDVGVPKQRLRKHDLEISTHRLTRQKDRQRGGDAGRIGENKKSQMTDSLSKTRPDNQYTDRQDWGTRRTRSDARASCNVREQKAKKDRTKTSLRHSWASKCHIWVDSHLHFSAANFFHLFPVQRLSLILISYFSVHFRLRAYKTTLSKAFPAIHWAQ